jgi:hypothetical protein
MAPPPRTRVELPPYPQPVGSYDTYEAAQRAVDHLADNGFPVENVAIVGTDLRLLERVTGRLSWGRAIGAGAASGAWFGVFVGLLFGLFAAEGQWLWVLLSSVVVGALFGAAFGAASYAATGGRRDFTSTSKIVAGRYEVLAAHKVADEARSQLARLALGNPAPPTT